MENSSEITRKIKEHLFKDAHIKYFFDVSVPAAKSRESVLGNVLFVCPDDETTQGFISLLNEEFPDSGCKTTSLLSNMRASDLGAILTNLAPGDLMVSQCRSLKLDEEIKSLLRQAATDFSIDIIIGKGPGARTVKIDLPQFTLVMCVSQASATVADLMPMFDYVIKVDDVNLPKICISKIKAECDYSIDSEACELLAYRAKYDIQLSLRYLSRIIEYAKYQNASIITRDIVDDALEITGMGIHFDDVEEDGDDMMQVFREINESLTVIKEDMNFMRSRMQDFLDANGVL